MKQTTKQPEINDVDKPAKKTVDVEPAYDAYGRIVGWFCCESGRLVKAAPA